MSIMLVDVSILESESKRVLSSEIFDSEENDAEKNVKCYYVNFMYISMGERESVQSLFSQLSA